MVRDRDVTGSASNPSFLLHKEGCTIDDYRLVVRIGEGSFGEVWKAERCGALVALKILKTSLTSDETQRELKSLETLRALRNPYLLHTENFWSDGDRLYIEMELADGGTLKERLRAHQAAGQRAIPAEELLKFFSEAAQGLDYLHGQRPLFLHRDIKPANILLVRGCAKLGDFGLLRQVAGDNSSTKTQGGTFPYMAPESISSDVFSPLTDLFSFAVSYVELRQGDLPFPGKNQYQICERILRAPPELADVFHPEERAVLARALAKEPRDRFRSCGEFVFELNRVVPWTAAVAVPEMAPVRAPEPSIQQRATRTAQVNIDDPGTSRKRPLLTMPELDLPVAARDEAGASTMTRAEQEHGAVRLSRPMPAETVVVAAAVTAVPPRAARAHTRSRALAAVGVAAAVVVLIVGAWLVMWQNARSGVQSLIAAKKYPEALAAVDAANGMILTDAGALREQIATAWFAELPEPGQAETPESLKRALRELDQYDAALPSRDSALARRGKLQERLRQALDHEVDDCLAAGEFDAARALVSRYETLLPNRGKAMQDRIQARQQAVTSAKTAEPATPTANNAALVDAALTAAWQPLLEQPVVLDGTRRALQQVRSQLGKESQATPTQQFSAAALAALVDAHAAPRDAGRKALAKVIALLGDRGASGDVGRKLWLGLVQLDRAKQLVEFDDLAILPAPPTDAVTKQAAADLFAQVVERRLGKDDYAWLPSKSEMARIIDWCEQRIGPSSGTVSALYVECLLASGADLAKAKKVELPQPGTWYTAYVRALVSDRDAAADALADIVRKDAKVIRPDVRVQRGLATLRRAADALQQPKDAGKAFATKADAGKASRWLSAIVALDAQPAVQDLGRLAVAAVQLDDAATLDALEKRVATRADPGKGFAALGNAYQLQLRLAYGKAREQAVAKGERSRQFAVRWRRYDLEEAAKLYADAVQLEVNAEAQSQAKVRVFEQALAKADDALFVPTIMAKLEFAWSENYKGWSKALPPSDFPTALQEGQRAMQLAEVQEKADSRQRLWWLEQRCNGMVRLADIRRLSFTKRGQDGEKLPQDKIDMELKEIRTLYEDARRLGRYPERWPGELAAKIGILHLQLKEPQRARDEFRQSLGRLEKMDGPYRDDTIGSEAQTFRDLMLEALKAPE
jgi:hypothetical protein